MSHMGTELVVEANILSFLSLSLRRVVDSCHIYDVSHVTHTCNTLQHAATRCNTLQHTTMAHIRRESCHTYEISYVTHRHWTYRPATHCNTLQHTATHCNTLQHTATHCNTLQHTATRCKTLQHTAMSHIRRESCHIYEVSHVVNVKGIMRACVCVCVCVCVMRVFVCV